jgi:integrase
MPRKRYPTITKHADGLWHAWVTVGTKPNGRPDQRHVKRATQAEAEERVDELLDQKRDGAVVKGGRPVTTQQWLTTYLDTVLPSSGRCDPGTIRDYRSLLTLWAFPVIGAIKLKDLTSDNLDEVYLRMRRAGRADSMVLKAHRVLSRALEVARRRKLVTRNVAKDMDSPTAKKVPQTPLTQEEAERFLTAVQDRRNGARWVIGLALGLRQGEALGLRWSDIDLDGGAMRIRMQLRRRAFEHGCDGACGRRRGGNCPQRVLYLRTGETAVLDLGKAAGTDRRLGLVLKPPKSGEERSVPPPDEIVAALRMHRDRQEIERMLAAPMWQDHDFVFARETGLPIDPKDDYAEWQAILAEVGIPATKLHNGRHTAGTIMVALGVPIEVVQEILGHSDVRTTRGYVHVASEMAKSATARMGRVLLRKASTP